MGTCLVVVSMCQVGEDFSDSEYESHNHDGYKYGRSLHGITLDLTTIVEYGVLKSMLTI
jgi:hypothetical protein